MLDSNPIHRINIKTALRLFKQHLATHNKVLRISTKVNTAKSSFNKQFKISLKSPNMALSTLSSVRHQADRVKTNCRDDDITNRSVYRGDNPYGRRFPSLNIKPSCDYRNLKVDVGNVREGSGKYGGLVTKRFKMDVSIFCRR